MKGAERTPKAMEGRPPVSQRVTYRAGRTSLWTATITLVVSFVAIILIVNRANVMPERVQEAQPPEQVRAPIVDAETSSLQADQDLRAELEASSGINEAVASSPTGQTDETIPQSVSEIDLEPGGAPVAGQAAPQELPRSTDQALYPAESQRTEQSPPPRVDLPSTPLVSDTSAPSDAPAERLRQQLTVLEAQLLLSEFKLAVYAGNSQQVLLESFGEITTYLQAAHAADSPIWTAVGPALDRLERRLADRLSARQLITAVDTFTDAYVEAVSLPRARALPLPEATVTYAPRTTNAAPEPPTSGERTPLSTVF